ncbi:unnamed protein product [Blepharisma stoltei]|uniref:Uncharacterized protein n=1 Tax=Blepharisma stoltei TaxID=1481888 RepID=A0AAU9K041_9CILI|nr:unnamed protein product [Blepharisma stoltei]
MNNKSLKGLENLKDPLSLLNYQMNTIPNDLNSILKKTENALNVIDYLKNTKAEILSRANNPELEKDFRATCSAYQSNSSICDPPLMQAYQDYLNAYRQKTSLYTLKIDYDDITNLIIYDTETETKEAKILDTPESLGPSTCITQLSNGKLFCFGNCPASGFAAIIDVDGRVELLPSGTPCHDSSYIYFNNSVYCFGGFNDKYLTLSSRFDLDQNRWIQLAPMPDADSWFNSIIFNGNILISGSSNRKLLLYSIDIDSFSSFPYEFAELKRKILINAEKLYLIECGRNGSIYERESEYEMNWRRIANSTINYIPDQVQYSYNKGGIYIGCVSFSFLYIYKFDLNKKLMSEQL